VSKGNLLHVPAQFKRTGATGDQDDACTLTLDRAFWKHRGNLQGKGCGRAMSRHILARLAGRSGRLDRFFIHEMAPSQELPPGFAIEIFLPMKRRRPCRASRVQDIKVAGTISICFDSMDVF
jgi:hypothetical protein